MIKLGMGHLGLSPISFYDMTLQEFGLAYEGYAEREDYANRGHWVRARWLATLTLSPHLKKGRKLVPEDLLQFPWEKADKLEMTPDELRESILARELKM